MRVAVIAGSVVASLIALIMMTLVVAQFAPYFHSFESLRWQQYTQSLEEVLRWSVTRLSH